MSEEVIRMMRNRECLRFDRQSKEAAHKEKIITKEKIYVVRQNISTSPIK